MEYRRPRFRIVGVLMLVLALTARLPGAGLSAYVDVVDILLAAAIAVIILSFTTLTDASGK